METKVIIVRLLTVGILLATCLNQDGLGSKPVLESDIERPVTGVMAFGWGLNFQLSAAVSLPYVDGFTAYYAWNDLEPTEGGFDFGAIDLLLEHVREHGKTINIGIYAGAHTPDWVIDKGVPAFYWLRPFKEDQVRSQGVAQEQRSPWPWDDEYLKYWKKFMSEVIERYKDDKSVGYISLTGPTIRDLTTGIQLREDSDWNRFKGDIGDDDVTASLVAAWIDVIEHFQKIDSHTRYALAVGPIRPGNPNVDVARAVSDYVIQKQYKNIAIMSVFLNDTWFSSGLAARRIRSILRAAHEEGFNIGYQMAQSAQRNSTWRTDRLIVKELGKSFEFGLSDGMQWVEVWHDDIIDRKSDTPNPKYTNEIVKVHEALKRPWLK